MPPGTSVIASVLPELQAITCTSRTFVELQGEEIFSYFENANDAEVFLDTWLFLVNQIVADARPHVPENVPENTASAAPSNRDPIFRQ
jgi:hypothetical protein